MEAAPPPRDETISRRDALRRAALLLGGALSAPAIAGVLAGCDSRGSRGDAWLALTRDQGELVATIAEHIIPETDTAGARSAGVHVFIDKMLAEHYPAAEKQRVLNGLGELDESARAACGSPFIRCTAEEQRTMLARVDEEAFADRTAPHWFRIFKEITVLGYYTSEVGATQELRHVQVPGRFDACVPFDDIGRAWAV